MNREALHPDSLEHAVFEKVRRCGADRADGQTIWHGGKRYDLTAHTISTIKTVHVVMESVMEDAPERGHQRAMAMVIVNNNGYHGGPTGCAYVLEALINGVRLPDRTNPCLSTFVLPVLEVPRALAVPMSDDDAA